MVCICNSMARSEIWDKYYIYYILYIIYYIIIINIIDIVLSR